MKKFLLTMLLMVAIVCSANARKLSSVAKFQGGVNVGVMFDNYGAGPTVDIDLGGRFVDHFYVGVATGLHTYFTDELYGYIPIGVNLKGYITKNRKVNPYVSTTIGGCVFVNGIGGFHCQAGAGIKVKRFTVGIGYNGILCGGMRDDFGYVKLGVNFGK